MKDYLVQSAYFGVLLTLATYELGRLLARRLKSPLINPMLFSIAAIIGVLLLLRIDYNTYSDGARYLTYLLTPATVCLAIPLYRQIESLKRNWRGILAGILSGILANLGTVVILAVLFGLNRWQIITILPKSITAAIGMPLSRELGGNAAISMVLIALTGVFGNMFAEKICHIFQITDRVAQGVAIGAASHVVGTAKAMEMGDIEGAMSGLSLTVSGLLTIITASIFANFL